MAKQGQTLSPGYLGPANLSGPNSGVCGWGEAQERGLVSKGTFLGINGGHSQVTEEVFLTTRPSLPGIGDSGNERLLPCSVPQVWLSLEEAGGTGLVFSS